MEDIVKRLRYGANCPVSGDGDNDKLEAAKEIESLRANLAEVTRERDELRELSVTKIMIDVCPGEDGMGEEVYAKSLDDVFAVLNRLSEKAEDADSFRSQLLATQAHAARMKLGMEEIASLMLCGKKDQLPGRCDKAKKLAMKALSTSINLVALHEDREDAERYRAKRHRDFIYSGATNQKVYYTAYDKACDYMITATHRAKKDSHQ